MRTASQTPSRRKGRREQGSALLMAMFCMALVCLAVAAMSVMINGQLQMNRDLVDRIKAREAASGALAQALAMLSTQQLDATITALPASLTSGTLGDGTYQVSIVPMDNGISRIAVTGTVHGIHVQIKVYVRKPNAGDALKVGMFTNNNLDISGSGTAQNGTHCNGDARIWGSVDLLTGNATAGGAMTVGGAANLHGGTSAASANKITMPVLDFNYYYQIALANGQVVTGDQTLTGTMSPAGGILWVNGNVTLTNVTLNGSLFATGNITTQKCTVTPLDNKKTPALATKDGYIDFNGCGNGGGINGTVWAQTGYIDWHGNAVVHGGVIANGSILCRGNWGALDYVQLSPQLIGDPRLRLLSYEE